MRTVWIVMLVLVPALASADKSNLPPPVVHDCAKQPTLSVTGDGRWYKVSGTCDSVAVKGNNNVLTIESAKSVSVTGDANTIVTTGCDSITVSGADNQVAKKPSAVK